MFDEIRRKASERITEKKMQIMQPITGPDFQYIFRKIVALDAAKRVIIRGLDTKNRTVTNIVGPPGSAKSLFLKLTCKYLPDWHYLDCSNSSGAGLIEFLRQHQDAKGVALDETDKLSKSDQETLYEFMEEGGEVHKDTKTGGSIRFSMPNCKVLATSNSTAKLARPFLSRFLTLHIKPYTQEEFMQLSVNLLEDYKIGEQDARDIGDTIWNVLKIRDVRMIKHLGSRIDPKEPPEDLEQFGKDLVELTQINGKVDYNK